MLQLGWDVCPVSQAVFRDKAFVALLSVTIDWTVRENVRAGLRVIIKRILRKYGYPPDKQARATELVLEQAEVLCVGCQVPRFSPVHVNDAPLLYSKEGGIAAASVQSPDTILTLYAPASCTVIFIVTTSIRAYFTSSSRFCSIIPAVARR